MKQIISSIIFITAFHYCTILTSANLNTSNVFNDLSKYVIPMHYSLNLSIMTQQKIWENKYRGFLFFGQSSITINILRPTKKIELHAINLVINSQIIMLIQCNIYHLERLSITGNKVVNLYFLDILLPGIYTLKINILNLNKEDNTENFFRSSNIKDRVWLVAPQIEMAGARGLFPCWDEPLLRTTFTISIKHAFNLTALSNMPIKTQTPEDPNSAWTHFYTTPPLSTYQVSIVLINFPHIHINDINHLWCTTCSRNLQSLIYMNQIIDNITLHLTSKFKDVEIPKIDHIALPNVPNNGTTKWGLIFHREADLIYNENLDPVMRKIEVAHNIAVKIAQQWFGNAGNLVWYFNTLLLHQSFAILFGEEAIVEFFNNPQMINFFVVQNQYESLNFDSYINSPENKNSSEIDTIFSSYYMKTLVYLRMIKNIIYYISILLFQDAVNRYVYLYMFAPVNNNPEFWQAEEAKTLIPVNFSTWFSYENIPIVYLEEKLSGFVLTQSEGRYFNLFTYYWIPAKIITETTFYASTMLWLTPKASFKVINYVNPNDWKIVDIQKAGYYRINYTSENWYKIAHYLNSTDRTRISVINRAKIIDDAFHFMIRGQLNASIFWNLTKYLSQETDYAVWYPMLKAFEYISSVFPLQDKINFIRIKEQIRELLANSLTRLGYEEYSTENILVKCLRQEITKWACILEHPECLSMARVKLEHYTSYPKLFKILPGWVKWTYCNGFMDVADTVKWPYIKKIVRNIPANKSVKFFHCFRDGAMINVTLKLLIYNKTRESHKKGDMGIYKYITIRDIINVFCSFVATHAKNNNTLETILMKFSDIKPREMSTSAALIILINNVYSTYQLNKIKYFLETERIHLGQLASKVFDKIRTRNFEIEFRIYFNFDILNHS